MDNPAYDKNDKRYLMDYTRQIRKILTFGLLFGCSVQTEAQYLERIYEYIENLEVFEENQEEGDTLIMWRMTICRSMGNGVSSMPTSRRRFLRISSSPVLKMGNGTKHDGSGLYLCLCARRIQSETCGL